MWGGLDSDRSRSNFSHHGRTFSSQSDHGNLTQSSLLEICFLWIDAALLSWVCGAKLEINPNCFIFDPLTNNAKVAFLFSFFASTAQF